MSAGFPHLSITPERRQLAFECCLVFEVITKRIATLDDIRKGMKTVQVLGVTILDIAAKEPSISDILFPKATEELITAAQVVPYIEYNYDDVPPELRRHVVTSNST